MSKIIEIGKARFKQKSREHCSHNKLTYDPGDKTVECDDCGRFIDPFDAFLTMARNMAQERASLNRLRDEVKDLRKKETYLLAARKAEEAWRRRSMVPTCPHCHEAIFPEDGFGKCCVNKQMAKEKRAFKMAAS